MHQINGKGLIAPSTDLPIQGMKMMFSTRNGRLTIEFEKSVSWIQFSRADAKLFVQGLIDHIKSMDDS